jgi:hypothetical protein
MTFLSPGYATEFNGSHEYSGDLMKKNSSQVSREPWSGKMLISLVWVFTLLIVGCKAQEEGEDSSLKWGHLSYASSAMLANVLPNETISLCGTYQGETREAIELWAAQIGRKGHLKFDMNCGPGKRINVNTISQAQMCAIYGMGPTCTVRGSAGGNSIQLVAGYPKNKGALLHEVGHLWGLCDQYGNPSPSANNCDALHRSAIRSNGTSSMGATFRFELAADDITGIRQLAARSDIKANVVWQNYLQSTPKPGPAPNPNPAPAAPPASSGTGPSLTKNANGSVTFTVVFKSEQKYVEVFSTQNGIQNVANAMQVTRLTDGSYRYSHTASGYKSGDQIRFRLYVVSAEGQATFLPGPGEQVWSPIQIY